MERAVESERPGARLSGTTSGEVNLHAIQRRWFAEDLVRRRRSDEERRFAAPQRAGHIDPNPHQVEAVIFALSRLADGGCILADEVGLGKTIEAGLVIAQLRAEGARRVLLVTPKPLVGQWRQELEALFSIAAKDATPESLREDGVFLIGREAAGSDRGFTALLEAPPFDLVVIDEAHEVFGGLYRRFDRAQVIDPKRKVARIATRVFEVVSASQTPVLLLTATPIQNSLLELWALVRFVDPTGTLLGDLATFRQTFCAGDGRALADGQGPELRRRISQVLQRTLRRQAQEFLSRPFVGRQARLFQYTMSDAERRLYEEVTTYLLTPELAAFRGSQRRLLLIGFHRRMASSTAALASSLEKVASRLERMLGAGSSEADDDELARDLAQELDDVELDELDPSDGSAGEPEVAPQEEPARGALRREVIEAELRLVRSFVERARSLARDGKSVALLEAAELVLARGREGQGSGKMIVFTESLVTQEYLRGLLIDSGLYGPEDITLFRGENDGPRAREALERWWQEVGGSISAESRPGRDVAMRLALVHELATRTRVMIATEAGAKGLNLQFCETVVNFDLPWNPQRIEQRIGRCHRYGQTRDVTVINFLARDNETARLTFEILSKKLDLFGTVLDASDVVLHRAQERPGAVLAGTIGSELESSLKRIWQRARTIDQVAAELRELRDRMGELRERFDEEAERTRGLIETWLDEDVRRVFSRRSVELPNALASLDRELARTVLAFLEVRGVPHRVEPEGDGARRLVIEEGLLPPPLERGVRVALGPSPSLGSLHLGHPLVSLAVGTARADPLPGTAIAVKLPAGPSEGLARHTGRRGRLAGVLARFDGLESVDRLLPIVLLESPAPGGVPELLPREDAAALFELEVREHAPLGTAVTAEDVAEAIEEALFLTRRELEASEDRRFELGLDRLERFIDDRLLLLRRQRVELTERLGRAEEARAAALSADAREDHDRRVKRAGVELEALEQEQLRLERRDDETYRRCREHLHLRRYAPGEAVTLFDVELVLE